MKTKSLVRLLTGFLVLAGLALAVFVSPWWLALAGFVGVNLFQSAFTDLCLAEFLLLKAGCGAKDSTNRSDTSEPRQTSPGVPSQLP